jgi:hypothetical protein
MVRQVHHPELSRRVNFKFDSTELVAGQYSMTKTFEILNFGHCDLPFDSFDLETLDRLAQGGESFGFAQDRDPVERLVEPFII